MNRFIYLSTNDINLQTNNISEYIIITEINGPGYPVFMDPYI